MRIHFLFVSLVLSLIISFTPLSAGETQTQKQGASDCKPYQKDQAADYARRKGTDGVGNDGWTETSCTKDAKNCYWRSGNSHCYSST